MKLDVRLAERVWTTLFVVICTCILLFLVLPLFVIVPFSLNSEPYFSYPIPGFSTRWYEEFFRSAAWQSALRNSFSIALPTMLLATLLGTLAALGLTLADFPMKKAVLALIMSPMMIPHIVIGLGLFFLYVRLGLTQTLIGMILAHTTLAVPFVVLTVAASLANFNKNLIQAAFGLGAGPIRVFFKVVLPPILPGVLAGALFAFVVSFDEVIVALLLSGPEQRTLPRQIWSGVRESISPVIMSVATLLIVLSAVLMLLVEVLRRRGERLQGAANTSGASDGQ